MRIPANINIERKRKPSPKALVESKSHNLGRHILDVSFNRRGCLPNQIKRATSEATATACNFGLSETHFSHTMFFVLSIHRVRLRNIFDEFKLQTIHQSLMEPSKTSRALHALRMSWEVVWCFISKPKRNILLLWESSLLEDSPVCLLARGYMFPPVKAQTKRLATPGGRASNNKNLKVYINH